MKSTRALTITLALATMVVPFIYAQQRGNPLERLLEAADAGHGDAQYRLALIYETGFDTIPADSVRFIDLLARSAHGGYAPAQNYLGFITIKGDGVTKNVHDGIKWIELAANGGDLKAYNNLGYLLSESEDIEHDYVKAAHWFDLAAKGGVPSAQASLADMYREGRGVPVDTIKADSLYMEAISRGLHDAEFKLLAMNHGKYDGMAPAEARELGKLMRLKGAPIVAAYLFEVGDSGGDADASTLLADAVSRGYGVPYDHNKGLDLFLKGAKMGNPLAALIVGEYLEMFPDAFPGQLETHEDATHWLELARKSGVTSADVGWKQILAPKSINQDPAPQKIKK